MLNKEKAGFNSYSKLFTKGTTAQFAREKLVKAESVRTRYCLTGSYFGIVPTKLENGRLAWPLDKEAVARGAEGVL